MTQDDRPQLPQVGASHYVALCAVCLAVLFLVQLQAGLLLVNLLCMMFGALSLATRWRLGPTLVILFVVAGQLVLQFGPTRYFGPGRQPGMMNISDVVLCAALLGFVVSHYRLQAVWYYLLPTDPRRRAGAPRRTVPWFRKQTPLVEERRPGSQITAAEIAWLVATLPVWAVAAQLAWALLPTTWETLVLPARLVQLMAVLWLLSVSFILVRMLLNLWKHRRHEPTTAHLYLQDLLWRDTRGEQRRVNRWLAWWCLKQRRVDQ